MYIYGTRYIVYYASDP